MGVWGLWWKCSPRFGYQYPLLSVSGHPWTSQLPLWTKTGWRKTMPGRERLLSAGDIADSTKFTCLRVFILKVSLPIFSSSLDFNLKMTRECKATCYIIWLTPTRDFVKGNGQSKRNYSTIKFYLWEGLDSIHDTEHLFLDLIKIILGGCHLGLKGQRLCTPQLWSHVAL